MRNRSRSAGRALALFSLLCSLLCWNGLAFAHKPSDSYLTVHVDERGGLSGRWDIALRDLDFAIGLDADGVALALLAFGIIGLGGNAIAGRVADRAPLLATAVMVTTLAISVIAASRSHGLLKAAVPLAIWGLTHTAGITLSQIRVTLAGAGAPAFAMTLNVSAANLGIALGASAGGWAVDQWGLPMLGVAPGMLALLVLLIAYGLANASGLRLRFRRARAEA